MKSNKGITLVALIITIIVMLILVGVSISVLINSDLIGTAQNAGDRTETAYGEEGNMSEITIGGITYNSIDEYISSQGGNAGGEQNPPTEEPPVVDLPNGNTMPAITAGTRAAEKSTYSDGTDTAVIPAKFTVSGVSTENTIEGGLVIYLIDYKLDENGNKTNVAMTDADIAAINWSDGTTVANFQKAYDQFVWIPIKNTTTENVQDINDMYICQGKDGSNGVCTIVVKNGVATCTNENHSSVITGTTTNKNTLMAGRLYAAATGNVFEQGYTEVYTSGSGLREPDIVTGNNAGDGTEYDGAYTETAGVKTYTYLSTIETILGDNTNYENLTTWKNALQTEYNNIVKSVYENEGFYVGRYETSGMAQATSGYDVAVIAGVLPSGKIDWYHMYAQQKKYASNNSLAVGSTMIQGAAYDQVMKFVNTSSYSVTTVGNVGHSTDQGAGARYQTGGLNYNTQTDTMTDYKAYNDVSKNIFDLEGNVFAWTTEAYDTSKRVSRGRSLRPQLFSKLSHQQQSEQQQQRQVRFIVPALLVKLKTTKG